MSICLPNIKQQPSPNYNQRPEHIVVDVLVIHNISLPAGEFGNPYIEQLFCNSLDCSIHSSFIDLQDLKVSAHFLIKRCGEVIQFVPLNYRAWHAGVSQFKGRKNCNDFSIGIELEGTDTQPYTDSQYQALIQLTRQIQTIYPAIKRDNIIGHEHIAPGRKTDPGIAFDWFRYKQGLYD